MALMLLSLLMVTTIVLNLYLFLTLQESITKVRRTLHLAATKAELSEVKLKASRGRNVLPKMMAGSIELVYNGQKALVDATFHPRVYRD